MSSTNEPPSTVVEDPSSGTAAVPAPSTEAAASPSAPSGAAAPQTTTTGGPQTPTNAPSPAARTGTPLRTVANGQEGATAANTGTSRAASQHPDTGFTMPSEAPPHGAPVRQYLNTKVTGPLLDGMKLLAKTKPQDPLRVLGEYLLQRSKELETPSGST
ncbi:hypothetical protein F5Y02DRAFT_377188 [Annulohypoxylon stygium]|nr:hypothetical protein F5Y02DRAFT_377188 [Annulohypoxylon stygium]